MHGRRHFTAVGGAVGRSWVVLFAASHGTHENLRLIVLLKVRERGGGGFGDSHGMGLDEDDDDPVDQLSSLYYSGTVPVCVRVPEVPTGGQLFSTAGQGGGERASNHRGVSPPPAFFCFFL